MTKLIIIFYITTLITLYIIVSRWSKLRKPLDKFLLPKKMDDYMVVFAEKASMACNQIHRICGQGVFELNDVIETCTMDIVFEIFLDIPGNLQLNNTMNLTKLCSRSVSWAFGNIFNPFSTKKWIFRYGRELQDVNNSFRPHLKKMYNDCLKKMEDRGYTQNDPDFQPQNYLEAAIDFGFEENSGEKIMCSVLDLIIAGFDTTGLSISSAILYLAMHPEYQEKAYEEQLSLMGSSLEAPTRSEMTRMKYLEMVFSETLRKVGPPTVSRTVSSQIEIDGYIFPEGAPVFFCFKAVANDPKHWENPDKFYPDHFLPENVAKRVKESYMPFAFGSRGCPGRRFALLSSMTILSILVRRFRFTTPLQYNELTYKYKLMVETNQGYPVEATPRPFATM